MPHDPMTDEHYMTIPVLEFEALHERIRALEGSIRALEDDIRTMHRADLTLSGMIEQARRCLDAHHRHLQSGYECQVCADAPRS